MTLDWDESGDLKFDDLGVYPVLATLVTHKGEYPWDQTGEQGTYLHTIRQDRFATGDQLRAAGQDALDQCKAEGLIQGGTPTAERLRTGSWELRLRWHVHGKPADTSVRF
jgi:hypothetical protein